MTKICDLIAVKPFEDDHILLGVGNELRCVGPQSETVLSHKIRGKIHGIDVNIRSGRILCYGEREYFVVMYKEKSFQLQYKGKCSDWISSGKILHNHKTCLVTGHMSAFELRYDEEKQEGCVLNESFCEDKTTLYCSHIDGNLWSNLLIFGGTAMDVIIWKPSTSSIIQRLSGRNGVTLSINTDEYCSKLITTSDDRSLKVYDVNVANMYEGKCIIDEESYIKSYGHTARVFKGKIISRDSKLYIITVGEDSNMCVWNDKGQLLFKRLHHFGSPIWNVDYDSKTETIFTTSADGNCRKYSIKKILDGDLIVQLSEDLSCMNTDSKTDIKLDKIAFMCLDRIIIGLTNRNTLVCKFANEGWKHFEEYIKDNDIAPLLLKHKCSIFKTYKDRLAIGAFNVLLLIKFEPILNLFKIEFNEAVTEKFIKSIFFLNEEEFLVSEEMGNGILLSRDFEVKAVTTLQTGRDPWITCAFKLEKYLLISNRQGHLYLYAEEDDKYELKDCIKKVNGNFGVTNICIKTNAENEAVFKTYGHDNTVKFVVLSKLGLQIKIIARENIPIAWIEKVISFDGEEYVAGFNSTNFVLWNKNKGQILDYNCGGGHRFWDCYLDFNKNITKLIYIKKGKVNIVETELFNVPKHLVRLKQHRWHSKECNVLRVLQTKESNYIISGGEDNVLKVFNLELDCSSLQAHIALLGEMNQHISSIKALLIYKIKEQKYLIFSAGGRAQICVTEFDEKTLQLKERYNFMLKSTDFERSFSSKAQHIDFDPETRMMALDVWTNSNNQTEIYAGCSDGYIRKFMLTEDKIYLVDELFYNKCLLFVRILNGVLMTTSTDGSIVFWDLEKFTASLPPLFAVQHHDSGVNSIDVNEQDNLIYIITGGDDQNVVYSCIKYTKELEFELIQHKEFNYLHTAQVTGVKFLENLNCFYSTSVDQTVCLFNIRKNELVEKKSMCVADIKGLELIQLFDDMYLGFVYGCGLENF